MRWITLSVFNLISKTDWSVICSVALAFRVTSFGFVVFQKTAELIWLTLLEIRAKLTNTVAIESPRPYWEDVRLVFVAVVWLQFLLKQSRDVLFQKQYAVAPSDMQLIFDGVAGRLQFENDVRAFTLRLLYWNWSSYRIQDRFYFVETRFAVLFGKHSLLLIFRHFITLICHLENIIAGAEITRIGEINLLGPYKDLNLTVNGRRLNSVQKDLKESLCHNFPLREFELFMLRLNGNGEHEIFGSDLVSEHKNLLVNEFRES